ncbi:MAG: tetraacyldisaccharide 4'-kinase [Alphaproteobacteria bacterium]
MIRQPQFWRSGNSAIPALLQPVACFWDSLGRIRRRCVTGRKTPIPSICVGNVTVGGAGKTPATILLADLLRDSGGRPALATRGYGARLAPGVTRVDPQRHKATEVGDEALLLARTAPCYVSRDRYAAALAAQADGATHILYDDGLQNPQIAYDCALLIVDGGYGFGNGRIIPAGPLRETPAAALARCRAMLIIGSDSYDCAAQAPPGMPVLRAELVPELPADFPRMDHFLAFAGIGRPEKFFDSCHTAGLLLNDMIAFPDHHPYTIPELSALAQQAAALNARLLTTAKDAARLPPEWRDQIVVFPVTLHCADLAALRQLLPH